MAPATHRVNKSEKIEWEHPLNITNFIESSYLLTFLKLRLKWVFLPLYFNFFPLTGKLYNCHQGGRAIACELALSE